MHALPRVGWIALALAALLSGCDLGAQLDLFQTDKREGTGRGPTFFDPYVGSVSPAVRLSLQTFNGCAIAPWGEPWSKGTMNIPYPAQCQDITKTDPGDPVKAPLLTPKRGMPLLAGTTYFLNQVTLAEIAVNLHKDMSQPLIPLQWIETQTAFKDLDWEGAGLTWDEWVSSRKDGAWERDYWFGNAAWMNRTDDFFTLEIFDANDAPIVTGHEYKRTDFLVENPVGGHTIFGWMADQIGAPQYPGDNVVHDPRPGRPGFAGSSPKIFRTIARLDMTVSTNPYHAFTLPPTLSGPGYIKLTWSQLPNHPFYWPVEFIQPDAVPATCFKRDDPAQQVPCSFGINPQVRFTAPANGKFYQHGETFEFQVEYLDGQGNLLHPADELWSYDEAMAGQANGWLVFFLNSRDLYREQDIGSMMKAAGPLQKFRVPYQTAFLEEYDHFEYPPGRGYLPNDGMMPEVALGLRQMRAPTRFPVRIPDDAEDGTWAVYLKGNRFWMGERQTKSNPFYFQVGQEEKTKYPQRVGNCQICHIGVLNLENIQMAIPEDDTEGCTICHGPGPAREVHMTHTLSRKWPRERRDCATCHLTRESALRPSLWVCSACHPEPHGVKFWQQDMTSWNWSEPPNILSNCAESCHMKTPPTAHILPER